MKSELYCVKMDKFELLAAFVYTHIYMAAFLGPWASIPDQDDEFKDFQWTLWGLKTATQVVENELPKTRLVLIEAEIDSDLTFSGRWSALTACTVIALLCSIVVFLGTLWGDLKYSRHARFIGCLMVIILSTIAIDRYVSIMDDMDDLLVDVDESYTVWYSSPLLMCAGMILSVFLGTDAIRKNKKN